jgi:hypothetical protein
LSGIIIHFPISCYNIFSHVVVIFKAAKILIF